MYLFIYGTMRNGEADSYYCSKTIVRKRVWTYGTLAVTKKGFCSFSPGNGRVFGQLNFVEEDFYVIKGLVEHYNVLNFPYKFILRSITVFADNEEIKASAFMYDTSEGLDIIDNGDWVSYQKDGPSSFTGYGGLV
jgi:gamma-glutamylcyclotransferase (GGCT)/AIG2-like uncharacterized protein YtfP